MMPPKIKKLSKGKASGLKIRQGDEFRVVKDVDNITRYNYLSIGDVFEVVEKEDNMVYGTQLVIESHAFRNEVKISPETISEELGIGDSERTIERVHK